MLEAQLQIAVLCMELERHHHVQMHLKDSVPAVAASAVVASEVITIKDGVLPEVEDPLLQIAFLLRPNQFTMGVLNVEMDHS